MSEKLTNRVTLDHEEIKAWIDKNSGRVFRLKNGSQDLRIVFPHEEDRDEILEEITWEEFFKEFDKRRLAFLFESEGDSLFYKFMKRD